MQSTNLTFRGKSFSKLMLEKGVGAQRPNQCANARLRPTATRLYTLESFRGSWRETKCQLLGHILRSVIAQVILKAPKSPAHGRPGRPRIDWELEHIRMPRAYLLVLVRPLISIKQAAFNRPRPFAARV